MWDLLVISFWPLNIVWTVLVALVFVYWAMVALGGLDAEFLDVDVDGEAELGLDGGAEAEVATEAELDADGEVGEVSVTPDDVGHFDGDVTTSSGGRALGVLKFFHVGEMPLMVLLSLLFVTMWVVSVLGTYYVNYPEPAWGRGVLVLAGSWAVSLGFVKVLGSPLARMYGALNTDYNAPRRVIGSLCVVETTTVSDRLGQVSVETKGAPLVLNAVTEDGTELSKGDEAVVIDRDRKRGVCIVAPAQRERSR